MKVGGQMSQRWSRDNILVNKYPIVMEPIFSVATAQVWNTPTHNIWAYHIGAEACKNKEGNKERNKEIKKERNKGRKIIPNMLLVFMVYLYIIWIIKELFL